MASFCQLHLTCKDKAEADKIAQVLLKSKLVACVKYIPVESKFLWEEKIDEDSEILLLMESREDLFNKIEEEVTKIHSYETFVLVATPLTRVSKKAEAWLNESLKKNDQQIK